MRERCRDRRRNLSYYCFLVVAVLLMTISSTAKKKEQDSRGEEASRRFLTERRWKLWRKRYRPHPYESEHHEQTAKDNFIRNDAIIEKHNSRDAGYVLGHNKFSDRYFEEKGSSRGISKWGGDCGSPSGGPPQEQQQILWDLPTSSSTIRGDAPPISPNVSVDWVSEGAVTPVKDQGNCSNGDWAFSAVGAMESAYKIQGASLTRLSESNLLSCCSLTQGCSGGYPIYSFACIMKDGLCLESDAPFRSNVTKRSCEKCNPNVALQGFDVLPRGDEDWLRAGVSQRPVSVWINSAAPSFRFYKSGVLDSKECETGVYGSALVVGFGQDSVSGKPYWILKNSWGTDWGENGYARLVRGKSMCGVAELAIVPLYVVKAKNSTLPCRTCDLGYGWTDLDHWVCEKCDVGYFANGTSECYPCDLGRYTAVSGQSECLECQNGRVGPTVGLSSCELCSWGFYPENNLHTCTRCSLFSYNESPEECKPYRLFAGTLCAVVLILVLCCFGCSFWLFKFIRAKSDHDQSERLLEESNDHVRALANGRRIMENEIKYGQLLARGQEGAVHAGVFGGTTKVAIKTSAKPVKLSTGTTIGKNELGLADILQSSEYELQMHICMRLRSERIVFFYGCGITREARIFTVFELMDCALSDTLWAERSRGKDEDEDDDETETRIVVDKPLLPWSLRLQYAADAAEGMQYLHSRNPPLLHRDLKSLNILVKGGRAKICDFGASKALQLGGLEDEYDGNLGGSSSSRGQHARSYTLGSLSSSKRRSKKKKNTSMSTFKTLLGSSSSTSIKTPLLKSASAALSFASIPSSSTEDEEYDGDNIIHDRTRTLSPTTDSLSLSSSRKKTRFVSFEAPLMTTKIGTPQWLAPELLCSDSENVPYSLPIDVYSFGCVLFEIMCQKPPWYFGAEKATSISSHHFHSVFVLQEVLSSGDRPRVPDIYSAVAPVGFQDLMHSCWKRNSSRRPNFDSIFLDLKNMIEKERVVESTSSGSSSSMDSATSDVVLLNNNVAQEGMTKEEEKV